MGCSFYELQIDQKYVKYQSTFNSTWYIGFDKDGNSISGHVSIKRDGSPESLDREKCYQFSKLTSLTTDTRLFPDAKKHLVIMNQSNNNIDNQTKTYANILSNDNLADDVDAHKNKHDSSDKRISSIVANQTDLGSFESLAEIADLLQSKGPIVHPIRQSQLIDINRYRNILRYQLGRKLGQSLVAIENYSLPPSDKTLIASAA